MSTELAKKEEKESRSGLIPMGHQGVTFNKFQDLWDWAVCVKRSGLAPKELDTHEKICVAMQYGMEIGLPPMQSLRSVAVINGRPCLWGDALPSLVWKSGKLASLKEWVEGKDDDRKAVCETLRAGQPEAKRTEFSVAQAKLAGLWNKNIWKQYPDRMLQMRARTYNFRDNFADALGGYGIVEEQRDIEAHPTGDVILSVGHKRPEPEPADEIPGEVVPETELPAVPDYDGLVEQLGNCNTPSDVQEIAAMYPDDTYWQQQCGLRTKEMMKTGTDLF